MNPKKYSEIGKAIGWLCGMKGKYFVPYAICQEAFIDIMPETLGRKFRDYCKTDNSIIEKRYYTTTKGTKIATYGANPKYKEAHSVAIIKR